MTPTAMDSTGTNLFPNFITRDDCRRAAPPFETTIADPTYPTKTWADPNPPAPDANGNVFYYRLPVPGEAAELIPFPVPAKWAPLYNLPGRPQFPAYTPAATQAFISSPSSSVQEPMNPETLSTYAQAVELLAELSSQFGITGQIVEQTVPVPGGAGNGQYNYPPGEDRRVFVIQPAATANNPSPLPINVGLMLVEMYGQGIGAPGSWVVNGQGYAWSPAQINQSTANGTVPLPAKPVPPGETILQNMFGQAVYAKVSTQ
jgi:hypothetical protein